MSNPNSKKRKNSRPIVSQASGVTERSPYGFNYGFWITIICLALMIGGLEFYASYKIEEKASQFLELQNETTITASQVAKKPKIRIKKELIHAVFSKGEKEYRTSHQHLRSLVKEEFALIEQDTQRVIKPWADWYFSVTGEYSRLAQLIMGDAEAYMMKELEERLLKPLTLDQRFAHLQSKLDQKLQTTMEHIWSDMQQQLDQLKKDAEAKGEVAEEDLNNLTQNKTKIKELQKITVVNPLVLTSKLLASVGGKTLIKTGVGLGAKSMALGGKGALKGGSQVGLKTGAKIGGKITQGVMSKMASKSLVKSAVALWTKLLVKFGVKTAAKGGSALTAGVSGSAICSPLGPAALLCGAGAAVFTWFAIDKIVVEVDEYFNRKQFEEDLHKDLTASLSEVEQSMLSAVDDYFDPLYLLFHSAKKDPNHTSKTKLIDHVISN